MLDKKSN